MKTKQILLSLLLALLAFACSDDNEKKPLKDQLPQHTQEFLSEFFPNNEILIIYDERGKESFSILLDHKIYIFFDEVGNWYSIKAEDGIPESGTKVIEQPVLTQLKAKEPEEKIVELSYVRNYHHIRIKLHNGNEYAQSFGFQGIQLASKIAIDKKDKLPQELASFLERNPTLSNTSIAETYRIRESKGDLYLLYIADAFILGFDKNGRWMHTDVKEYHSETRAIFNKIIANEIPKEIRTAVPLFVQTTSLGDLTEIIHYQDGTYAFRFVKETLLVNKDGEFMAPASEAALKLTDQYFGSPKDIKKPKFYINDPYGFYASSHEFMYENSKVNITMHLDGNWIVVMQYEQKGEYYHTIPLPKEFIENELPHKIFTYLNINGLSERVHSVYRDHRYIIDIDTRIILTFDEDGNFLKKEESKTN